MGRKRTGRPVLNKTFVSGGIYNPNDPPQAAQTVLPQQQNIKETLVIEAKDNTPSTSVVVKEEVDFDDTMGAKDNTPSTSVVVNDQVDSDDTMAMNAGELGAGGTVSFKEILEKRKRSSERARDKKLLQNQLRKSMLPKNALMALNEVKGISISDFTISSNPDGGFTAAVTVNNRHYEAKGSSKMSAKNVACEMALRDYIISKMQSKAKKKKMSPEVESMDANDNEDPGQDDDIPMLNLGSFAIYKLFAEWEREGYVIPELHPAPAGNQGQQGAGPSAPAIKKEPKKPPIRSELPPNWETMHPATLLCVMRPGLSYVDHGAVGQRPNVMMRMSITIGDQEVTADGRSKKIARHNVAVNVCNSLFGTKFTYE